MVDRSTEVELGPSQTGLSAPFVNYDAESEARLSTKESPNTFCGLKSKDPNVRFKSRVVLSVGVVLTIVIIVLILVFVVFLPSTGANYSSTETTVTTNPLFQSILPPGWPATGIRQDINGNVVITGATALTASRNTTAFIYYGPIDEIPHEFDPPSSLHLIYPEFPGEVINASMLYGPNSAFYDSRIGIGNVTAVGTYNPTNSIYQSSFIYEGSPNGTGAFTKIMIPTALLKSGLEIYPTNTLAHSTMGDLVVGDVFYTTNVSINVNDSVILNPSVSLDNSLCKDLSDFLNLSVCNNHTASPQSTGMIYNKYTNELKLKDFGLFSTTLYGIWQNGGQYSSNYTLIGGASDFPTTGTAFIVNYDYANDTFSHFTKYYYNNDTRYDTHFEGITGVPGGFTLAAVQILREGTSVEVGSSLVYIPVDSTDGSFGPARWYTTNNTINGLPTSGNTVIDFTMFGLYQLGKNATDTQKSVNAYMYNFSSVVDLDL